MWRHGFNSHAPSRRDGASVTRIAPFTAAGLAPGAGLAVRLRRLKRAGGLAGAGQTRFPQRAWLGVPSCINGCLAHEAASDNRCDPLLPGLGAEGRRAPAACAGQAGQDRPVRLHAAACLDRGAGKRGAQGRADCRSLAGAKERPVATTVPTASAAVSAATSLLRRDTDLVQVIGLMKQVPLVSSVGTGEVGQTSLARIGFQRPALSSCGQFAGRHTFVGRARLPAGLRSLTEAHPGKYVGERGCAC